MYGQFGEIMCLTFLEGRYFTLEQYEHSYLDFFFFLVLETIISVTTELGSETYYKDMYYID